MGALIQSLLRNNSMILYHDFRRGDLVDLSGIAHTTAVVAAQTPNFGKWGIRYPGSTNVPISTTDTADLSFGNGVTDSPVTFVSWFITPSVPDAVCIEKSAALNAEYYFASEAGRVYLVFYSGLASAVYIGKSSAALLVPGSHFLCGTYNGSSLVGGVLLYDNGVAIGVNNYTSGVYVAMNNGTANVNLAKNRSTSIVTTTVLTMIINRVLTATEIAQLYGEVVNV